jgi:protein-L-isoaspartate(D-aspartate) O-methyltransferase
MLESQLMPCGVVEPRLVAAFDNVPREAFVAPERARLAYVDAPQPIGSGRMMPAPLTLGRLLQRAEVQPHEKVLLVGGATGYSAAIMARMGADVIALESDAGLAAAARARLEGLETVRVVEGLLEAGAADFAPFDLIFIDSAVEVIPDALVEQLSPEGRLVLVLVCEDGVHRAAVARRSSTGLSFDLFAEAPAPVLTPFRALPSFRF